MNEAIQRALQDHMSQSQAAALMVICTDIRQGLQNDTEENAKQANEEAETLLRIIEDCCLESIATNDGLICFWIGTAAKQMNPLLQNNN